MSILVTGASGFLGSAIVDALASTGCDVIGAVRNPGTVRRGYPGAHRYIAADFTRDTSIDAWLPRLDGVDAVINAVGILQEHGIQTFDRLHAEAPCALFAACAAAGVRRVVQISALGADAQAESRYHLSKRRADDCLLRLPLAGAIVQPSLVYGAHGTSAQMFRVLASMPIIPLPGSGRQPVQPIHIDDVVAAVVALLQEYSHTGRLALVGPEPIVLQDYLATLRRAMGLGSARFMRVPARLMLAIGSIGGTRLGLPDRETLAMLERGNTADVATTQELLGRPPRPPSRFIVPGEADAVRSQAKLGWHVPLLRVSIAAVWIWTGIVSLGLYPVARSYELLAQVGVTGMLAGVMLYGAGVLDLGLGVATLVLRRRRWLWRIQAALILGYTLIISWKLPEFWLHPYGPILKNLPLLAALWLLHDLEERRWNT